MHGGSQAVRLPKEFRFEGNEVLIRKQGKAVVLEPAKPVIRDTAALWAKIDRLRGDAILTIPDDPPPEDVPF
jgi:antitoxin VapB